MPAAPAWLSRLPEIIDALFTLESPVVDRATCERIFQLKRRRAIDLMQHFGGYRSGNVMLLDRTALVQKLHDLAASPRAVRELERKQKLTTKLDELRRVQRAKAVSIRVLEPQPAKLSELQPAVQLKPGVVEINYTAVEDLLMSLYGLAQLAANHFDDFCEAVDRK